MLACTSEEFDRLKGALSEAGPNREPVELVIQAAESYLTTQLDFPARGGQHNQWYQCEKCQLGLATIDQTHHRCPRCGTVYTGAPYDDVIYARKHVDNHDQNMVVHVSLHVSLVDLLSLYFRLPAFFVITTP